MEPILGRVNMDSLRRNRIDRSDECWADAGISEISKANRLKLYFDSVFLGLLGVLYQADSPILATSADVDVAQVFKDARQFLNITEEDIAFGLCLSNVVFQFNLEVITSVDLESAREWAYRVRQTVLVA